MTSTDNTVFEGLRILARIIAREELKRQLADGRCTNLCATEHIDDGQSMVEPVQSERRVLAKEHV